eukprot:INCI6748.1.p1 GENE.INCI6748.1~~INCI6748.1.p1  ORF type:complete len:405 (-),score=53.19 INCI6748.1:222-1436(-)
MASDFAAAFPFRVVPSRMIGDGIPPPQERQRSCNCKNSKCLKLYCECFASGKFCRAEVCRCNGCNNNNEHADARKAAVFATLFRNPSAFRPKIAADRAGWADDGKRKRGCHCRRSGCLKKYCECFQADIFCGPNCKCANCKNFAGCPEREALSRAATTVTVTGLDSPKRGPGSSPIKMSPIKNGSPRPALLNPLKRVRQQRTSAPPSPQKQPLNLVGDERAPSAGGLAASNEFYWEPVAPKIEKVSEIFSPALIEIFCRRLLETSRGVQARAEADAAENGMPSSVNQTPSKNITSSDTMDTSQLRLSSPANHVGVTAATGASDECDPTTSPSQALLHCSEVVEEEGPPEDVAVRALADVSKGLDVGHGGTFDSLSVDLRQLSPAHRAYSAVESAVLSEMHFLLK